MLIAAVGPLWISFNFGFFGLMDQALLSPRWFPDRVRITAFFEGKSRTLS
jgi:hypothetical protein